VPEPLPGSVLLADFTDPMEAHLALAALHAHGIEASLLSAPRDPDEPRRLPDRGGGPTVGVVVLEGDELLARRVLDEVDDDLPAEFNSDDVEAWSDAIEDRSRARRARSRRQVFWSIVVLFVIVVVALVVGAVATVRG
jgi:hypothetical protein